ncbi:MULTISPECIES: hypothetical protein [Streptomyces]|uniref:DUF3558 domain-containing protein n=1 Tax=Streptomyces morookaense TaxID=1970 RepID=A0A7Y7B8W8_STRMO|nr:MULTISPECIES: hypothetical protein [Streptomyces]MCC2279796.1 hypothetical protein [Streptomyces sp. ET3-23]NVK81156.1 hypothetical protein [Streptomyces morookaense]GHF49026.1 hypothetical protein GCM10010359_59110 [Streptomyces morookaense]
MQHRAYAPAAALAAIVLAAGLAGCSSRSGATGGADDARPGHSGASAPAGQPGKYHSLPEPCSYVGRDTLRRMLPDGAAATDDDDAGADKLYKGQPTITYDTDRRVGCRWKVESPDGARHLSVDFERVVSYQPGVSDEARAQELYARQAGAAHIPAASGSPSASASAPSPSTSASSGNAPGPQLSASPAASPSASASASPSADPALAPRTLDDLGDDAFIDDRLATAASGVHRDVTVVFRSSNVLVTIAYDQWSTDKQHVPSAQDLQGKAHGLARELDAGHFGN